MNPRHHTEFYKGLSSRNEEDVSNSPEAGGEERGAPTGTREGDNAKGRLHGEDIVVFQIVS